MPKTLKEIIINDHKDGLSTTEISNLRGIKYNTVYVTLKRYKNLLKDDEIIEENVKLKNQVQRLQDKNRIENKSYRNHARISNNIEILHEKMISLLEDNEIVTRLHDEISLSTNKIGILQLSDLHLNELVDDIETNKYNLTIASKRLYYFTSKAIKTFESNNISHVIIAMTGDLLNSDRRVSEITQSATNRMNSAFIAIEILSGVIQHLNEYFNLSIYSITGNESRTKDFVDWTNFLASDSYDLMIHNCLMQIFKNSPGIYFEKIINPIECVINIDSMGILMLHGHSHKNIAKKSANINKEIRLLRDKYSTLGINVYYTIMGHIHEACISDLYARSSSLVGDNSYSSRALNCFGRASQNIYIIDTKNKLIDGIKIDLQGIENKIDDMYKFSTDLISYNQSINTGSNIYIVNTTII